MTTADIHALTGAYALDAVSGTERMEFEGHLAECESCAQEVQELRETATRLALAATAPPPPALKGRVLDQIRNVRQLPPETTVTPLRRRSLTQRLSMVAAAVFFVAAAGLGFVAFQQGQELDDRAQAVQLEQIMRASDSQLLTVDSRDGGTMKVAVSRSADRMMLFSTDMPTLPTDRTYQLWALDDTGSARSMGLFQSNDGNVSMTASGFAEASQVGVSIEPGSGSETPTVEEIVIAAPLPTV